MHVAIPTKPVQSLVNAVATVLAITLQKRTNAGAKSGSTSGAAQMTLHSAVGGRKYLNAAERHRFMAAVSNLRPEQRVFCLMLLWSGCRITEALSVTASAIDLDSGVVSFETLKRRMRGVVRQVPLPPSVLKELDEVFSLRQRQRRPELGARKLWLWSRSTAWRHVKEVMRAADISGCPASPKGLRHSFGVAAFQVVPPHLVQRWLGHASLRTTAIYGNVSGPEELDFAKRLWAAW